MTLNDKVQVGDSTTGTSTSTTTASQWQTYNRYKAEQGWECPRCGRINAPWKSTCDCSGKTYWYPTWEGPYYYEWWKHVTCTPETTWKAPSSVCSSDSTTRQNSNSTIYTTAADPTVGSSDYWDNMSQVWINNPQVSNKINPNTTTTAWNNGPSTQTIHDGNTNTKEEQKKENTPPRILNKYIKEKK